MVSVDDDNVFVGIHFSTLPWLIIAFLVFFHITRMFELYFKKIIKLIGALRRPPEFFEVGKVIKFLRILLNSLQKLQRKSLKIIKILTTFPTSKNSGSHLRAPINLIPFLNESSNTLVVGKTIENASGSRGKVEKWIPNKTLSSSTETMYAPI